MCVKHRENTKNMRSDKCKKDGFDRFLSLLLLTKACSNGRSNLVHVCSATIGWVLVLFHILAHFTQCWGSLEPSHGGMLEVIVAVGSRSGLC